MFFIACSEINAEVLRTSSPGPRLKWGRARPGVRMSLGRPADAGDDKTNAHSKSTRILIQGVEEFLVAFDEDRKSLVLDLQLVSRGSKRSGGRARDQRAHDSLRLNLENTAPD